MPKDKLLQVRVTGRDYRRLFVVARKLSSGGDELTVSNLVRDVLKKGIMGTADERREFNSWLAGKLDHLERRQMLVELQRGGGHRLQDVTEARESKMGRLTRGAV